MIFSKNSMEEAMDSKNTKPEARSCPWCGQIVEEPKVALLKNEHGEVRERRCTHCGKILAAYFEQEGGFMGTIRSYQ
jgi:hypothetical protein